MTTAGEEKSNAARTHETDVNQLIFYAVRISDVLLEIFDAKQTL